jgi:hypothetical protein
MPPKKDKKRKSKVSIKTKAKATAKSIVNINIGGKGKSPRKSVSKQVTVQTSPTIYTPAPTPFYVTPNASQSPAPISSAAEIAQELRRLEKTSIETAIQPREFLRGPTTALPTGAFEVNSQFNNMEVPTSFTQLETTPARTEKRGRPKGADIKIQQSKEEARRVLDRMGIPYRESDSLGTLQTKYRDAVSGLALMGSKKDPFV